jgi:hypothetical protein
MRHERTERNYRIMEKPTGLLLGIIMNVLCISGSLALAAEPPLCKDEGVLYGVR